MKSCVDISEEDDSQWFCPIYEFSSNFIHRFIVGLISTSHSYVFRIRWGKKSKNLLWVIPLEVVLKKARHTFSPHRYVVY